MCVTMPGRSTSGKVVDPEIRDRMFGYSWEPENFELPHFITGQGSTSPSLGNQIFATTTTTNFSWITLRRLHHKLMQIILRIMSLHQVLTLGLYKDLEFYLTQTDIELFGKRYSYTKNVPRLKLLCQENLEEYLWSAF